MDPATLDLAMRAAAVGLVLAKAAALAGSTLPQLLRWSGLVSCAAYAAHLSLAFPGVRGSGAGVIAGTIACAGPLAYWMFARALLVDGWRVRGWHLLLLLPLAGAGAALLLGGARPGGPWAILLSVVVRGTALVLIVDALLTAGRGYGEDLVPPRRRLRIALLIAGPIAIVLLLAGPLAPFAERPPMLKLAGAAATVLFAAVVAWLLLRLEIGYKAGPPVPDALPDARDGPACADTARLIALMAEAEPWRDADLTIAALAERARLPVYRLRRIIHEELGHRNFSSFVNDARITAAARALADPQLRRMPILTIALNHGFGSIGPFNRAFRARHGKPPSAFRAEAVGG